MDVTEQQHIDAVRTRLYQRYPDLDPTTVDGTIYAAHHRFDGCRIRDFVPLLVERAAIRALDNTPPTTRPEFLERGDRSRPLKRPRQFPLTRPSEILGYCEPREHLCEMTITPLLETAPFGGTAPIPARAVSGRGPPIARARTAAQ